MVKPRSFSVSGMICGHNLSFQKKKNKEKSETSKGLSKATRLPVIGIALKTTRNNEVEGGKDFCI